jgi:hypothetical protein
VATTIGFTVATSAVRKRNHGKRSPEELVLVALLLLVVFPKRHLARRAQGVQAVQGGAVRLRRLSAQLEWLTAGRCFKPGAEQSSKDAVCPEER